MTHRSGEFTNSLFSLQLQIKTLLDGAGGDDASALLDTLSQMNKSERKVALTIMNKALLRVLKGEKRLESLEDKEQKEFEESLYKGIVNAFGPAIPTGRKRPPLSVVKKESEQPKRKKPSRVVHLEEFRTEKNAS